MSEFTLMVGISTSWSEWLIFNTPLRPLQSYKLIKHGMIGACLPVKWKEVAALEFVGAKVTLYRDRMWFVEVFSLSFFFLQQRKTSAKNPLAIRTEIHIVKLTKISLNWSPFECKVLPTCQQRNVNHFYVALHQIFAQRGTLTLSCRTAVNPNDNKEPAGLELIRTFKNLQWCWLVLFFKTKAAAFK